MDGIDPGKLWQNFVDTVTNHYADFNGRVGRAQFWYYVLVSFLAGLAVAIVASITTHLLSTLFSLAILLPNLGMAVRRLHDTGKPGIWVLIAAAPIVLWILLTPFLLLGGAVGLVFILVALGGLISLLSLAAAIVLIYLCAQPGQPDANQYGPVPTAWSPAK